MYSYKMVWHFVGALLLYLNVLTQDVGTLLMRYKLLIFFVLGGALYILWAFTFLYQCANRSCKDIIYLFFLFHNYSYDMFYIFRCLLTQIAETKFIGSEIILFFVSCLFLGLTWYIKNFFFFDIFIYMHIYIHIYIYIYIFLSIYQSIYLSIYLSISMYIRYIYICIYML